MNQELLTLTNRIDNIVQELLIPVRTQKKINRNAFDLFYSYLDEIVLLVQGQELILRKLTGLLFFIYTSLEGAMQTTDYEDPIFIELAKLEEYLDKIFWDFPFK